MKVVARLNPENKIIVRSQPESWVNTFELCSSTSNPLITTDYYIMVLDVPKPFLEYLSKKDVMGNIFDNVNDVERTKCYIHIFAWDKFVRNCSDGWKINKLYDPYNVFNDKMMNMLDWVMELFSEFKKSIDGYSLR